MIEILRCYVIIRLLDKFSLLLNLLPIFIQRDINFKLKLSVAQGLLNGSAIWER
jgi:hypothetical protein